MRKLAEWVVSGVVPAVGVIISLSALSLLVPVLSLLSGAALALAQLRFGSRFGAPVALLSAAGFGGFLVFAFGVDWQGVLLTVGYWLPVLIAAEVLRVTRSLAISLASVVGMGLAFVLLLYGSVGDPVLFWQEWLDAHWHEIGQVIKPQDSVEFRAQAAQIMTAVIAVVSTLGVVISLLIGRAWQAMLVNPGGFRSEFHALRFGKVLALLTIALTFAGILAGSAMLAEMSSVLMLLFVFQALAIAHALVAHWGVSGLVLIPLYLFLFLFGSLVIPSLVMLAIVDNWLDVRKKLARAD